MTQPLLAVMLEPGGRIPVSPLAMERFEKEKRPLTAHVGKHGAMNLLARLLFALVVAGLLGIGISATHSKPALASGACYPATVLTTASTVQTVPMPGGSYKITVQTALWSGNCGQYAQTTVSMSQCTNTALAGCSESGTAGAWIVGSDGGIYGWTLKSFSLSAPFLGSSSPVSFFTHASGINCGAAHGSYAGSGGENMSVATGQQCG